MSLNDQKIINAVISGKDEEILSDLYRYLLPDLVKYIRKNSGSREEAEDVFQDGVIILLRKIKLNEFNQQYTIKGYFFTICKNLYLNKIRKEKRMDYHLVPGENIDVAEDDLYQKYFSEEKTKIMKEVLDGLGEQCKKLMVFVFYYNYGMKEIAEKMGLKSADVAKSMHYRCKKKLTDLLEKNKYLVQYLREQ